jgi:hypothetical protein
MRRFLARSFVALVVLLALGASGVMCARVADRGRYATAYSTYSAGPEGARAIYELVRRAGHPTQRWVEDLEGLPERGVLMALGGCLASQRRPLSRYERESLLAWVRRGGTLMVFGAESYLPEDYPAHLERYPGECARETLQELMDELQGGSAPAEGDDAPIEPPLDEPLGEDALPLEDQAQEEAARRAAEEELEPWRATWDDQQPVFIARTADGPLANLEGVHMVQPAQVEVAAGRSPTRLAHFGERPSAVQLSEGDGSIVVFASASMMLNQAVLEQRGGVLLTRLLAAYARPDAPVVFDEYHLGTGGARSLVRYLRQAGAGVVLLQILVLLALWVLRSGRRLGELEDPPREPPGGTVSYVAATSALYSRSADRGGIGRVLLVRALERIASHHRVRAREPQQVLDQLREMRRDEAANACAELLSLFSESVDGEKGLVALASRVDALVQRANAPRSFEPLQPRDARQPSLPSTESRTS